MVLTQYLDLGDAIICAVRGCFFFLVYNWSRVSFALCLIICHEISCNDDVSFESELLFF
jgi:hypothetical protein